MRRFRPIHGILLVLALSATVIGADYFLSGSGRIDFARVGPDRDGRVTIDVADLQPLEVRYFRFLNAGNQEVLFFVGRDESGQIVVAFNASENDFKRKRGFRHDGAWMVNNKCDTAIKLSEVNLGRSGCGPMPLPFRASGAQVVLAENDILGGWRYFR